MIKKSFTFLIVFFLFLATSPSGAAELTFVYEGSVNGVLVYPPGADPSNFQPFIGKTIHIEYTFEGDSSLNPDQSQASNNGSYNLISITAIIDGMVFSGNLGRIFVSNGFNAGRDEYEVLAETNISTILGSPIGGFQPLGISMRFTEDTGLNPLSNDHLPLSPPDPNAFGNTSISISFGNGPTLNTSTQRRVLRAFRNVQMASPASNPPLIGDSFLQRYNKKNFNEGANHVLVIDKKGRTRAIVSFNLSSIVPEMLNSARLVFTLERPVKIWKIPVKAFRGHLPTELLSVCGTDTALHIRKTECEKRWKDGADSLDAHLLTDPFTEGNGFLWGQNLGLRNRGSGSGVTWNCATDADISNRKGDCEEQWKGGADAIESVTDRAEITDGQTGEVSWDVTSDVQAALAAQAPMVQWLIRKTWEHRNGQAVFYSKEGAAELGDMTKAPRLELEFLE